jgi:hypothetical protein
VSEPSFKAATVFCSLKNKAFRGEIAGTCFYQAALTVSRKPGSRGQKILKLKSVLNSDPTLWTEEDGTVIGEGGRECLQHVV